MNIARAFANYMVTQGLGTLQADIFIGGAPAEPHALWWLISSGGSTDIANQTGERVKNYTINLFYRDLDPEEVYEKMQAFEEELNSKDCKDLGSGYDTVDIEAVVFPSDQDLDNQDRTVGMMEVRIKVYSA